MTITAGSFCRSCGTPNTGTRFCESCGQPVAEVPAAPFAGVAQAGMPQAGMPQAGMPQSVVAHPTAQQAVYGSTPIAGTTARRGSPLYVVTLVGYLVSLMVSELSFLIINTISGNYEVGSVIVQVLYWGSILVTGISAAVAGFSSKATPGRKVGGGMLGLAYLLWTLVQFLFGFGPISFGVIGLVFSVLAPLLLFLSWGIARPFHGIGFIAIVIGLVLWGINFGLQFIPFIRNQWQSSLAVAILGELILVAVTIATAIALESKHPAPAPVVMQSASPQALPGYPGAQGQVVYGYAQPGYAPYGPRTNTLAIVSMIFGIIGGGLVAVILGHVALGQIRRTGESGNGMAVAGLVLGYFWLLVSIVYIIWVVAGLTSIYGALNSYGY